MTDATESSSRSRNLIKWGGILLLIAALLVIGRMLPVDRALEVTREWIDGLGAWGPLAFVLLYVLATVLLLPGSILTIAAGAFFGLGFGLVLTSLSATTGAACAFLIARYGARRRVARLVQDRPKLRAVDQAVGEGGWKIVALLRLSPVVPFNIQNYFYGLTPIRFWPYVLTSWLAMLPGTFMYVYLGYAGGLALSEERQRTIGEWVLLGAGLVATVLVTVYVTRLARRKLHEQTRLDETEAGQQTPRQAAASPATAEAS